MAERTTLSIDGYTHTGGIMAKEIAVNSVAFDRIADAGRLRRNLSVVWTNELPPKRILGLGRKTHHPLFERGGAVILRVNGDLLLEKAKARAKRRSDDNEGYYHALKREEFVRGFSREVAGALKSILYTDNIAAGFTLRVAHREEPEDPASPINFVSGYWEILKNQSRLIVDRNLLP